MRDPQVRWKEHVRRKEDTHFSNALKKHGKDNFIFMVIHNDIESKEDLDRWEKWYICHFESNNHKIGYNSTSGGGGCIFTDETKQKISDAKPKKIVAQYDLDGNYIRTYKSISEASKATGISTTVISKCCKGKRRTSKGFIWKYIEEDILAHDKIEPAIQQEKPVSQYEMNGNHIGTYKSISEASRATGTPITNISHCCNGRHKTSGGFIWKLNK